MTRRFRELAEAQIRKAEANGDLSGLAGEGKPLPDRPGDRYLDPGESVGHRIMAEAGALPEEILLKRQLSDAKDAYAKALESDKKAAMAKIADLELKLAIAQEARRKFLG